MSKYIVSQENYNKLNALHSSFNSAWEYYMNGDIESVELFNFVFNDDGFKLICKIIPSFDPYIPDASYEDDASAVIRAFDEIFENLIVL